MWNRRTTFLFYLLAAAWQSTAESLYLIFKSGPNDQGQTTNGKNATKGQNEKYLMYELSKG